mgnify:CR=1 FL=1
MSALHFDGFGKLNNASAAFMTCWWNRTRAKLKLQVPAAALGRTEFVVSAMVSRGDGVHALLHEPLTATDTNVYRLDLAPNGVDLDLVQPQLALRLPRGLEGRGAKAARGSGGRRRPQRARLPPAARGQQDPGL